MVTRGAEASSNTWIRAGALMGILAGIILAAFEVVAALIAGDNPYQPFRMAGAIMLGEDALLDSTWLFGVAATGALVHISLSAGFGVLFALLAAAERALYGSRLGMIIGASLFGLVVWLINFYLAAPLAFEWFTDANPLIQFVAHAFFFGTSLGLLMSAWFQREAS